MLNCMGRCMVMAIGSTLASLAIPRAASAQKFLIGQTWSQYCLLHLLGPMTMDLTWRCRELLYRKLMYTVKLYCCLHVRIVPPRIRVYVRCW